MKNVAVYYRVSTNRQDIVSQEHVLDDWIAKQPPDTKIVKFVDRGMSGKRDDRPAYRKMVKAALAKEFDIIVAFALDRLSRNAASAIRLLLDLDDAGVEFIAVSQPHLSMTKDQPFRRPILAMFAELAEMERSRLIDRVRAGMSAAKAAGKHLGRRPLPADTVNKIHNLRAEGRGMAAIAQECGISLGSVHKALKTRE